MEDAIIGTILPWAAALIPRGWMLCNGSILSVSAANQPLFSILGANFGGNGINTFALPDLRGRIPLGFGGGHDVASKGGSAGPVMQEANLPVHTHQLGGYLTYTVGSMPGINVSASLQASDGYGNSSSPQGNYLANSQYDTYQGQNFSSDGSSLQAVNGLSVSVAASNFEIPFPAPSQVAVTNQNAGGGQPLNCTPPYMTINFIICYAGEYPSHS
jgi:microcystin-dependent protein